MLLCQSFSICPLGGSGLLHNTVSVFLVACVKRLTSGTQALVWTHNQCVTAQLRVCSADFSGDNSINKHNPTLKPVMHEPDNVWEIKLFNDRLNSEGR